MQDNVIGWFSCAQKAGLGVQRMEDLILVSGCTLAPSWAAATFVDDSINADISLESRRLSDGGENFIWSNIQGPVIYHNSLYDPVRAPANVYSTCTNFSFFFLPYGKQNPQIDQCLFIRGFRAKRRFFWIIQIRAAAEPRPDDPDNRGDDEIQMTRAPGVPKVGSPPNLCGL